MMLNIILRKNFVSEIYLKISEKKQKITVLILIAILLAVTVFCLITRADKITILYNLLYYTVFITSNMLGLVLTGCIFQYLKEKSGTIWIPVLVHAILDYMVVLNY